MQQVTKEIMYAQSNDCNECNKATNLKHMVNLIAQVYYGHWKGIDTVLKIINNNHIK